MARLDRLPNVTEFLGDLEAAFDIGEQECERAFGKVWEGRLGKGLVRDGTPPGRGRASFPT